MEDRKNKVILHVFTIGVVFPPSPIKRDEINKQIKIHVIKGGLCSKWLKLQVSTYPGVGDNVHLKMGSDGPHVSVLVTFLT